jgi:hypothetical protein
VDRQVALTPDELCTLRHALGLVRSKKPTRNYLCADPDDKIALHLAELGMLVPRHNQVPSGGMITYVVTQLGKETVDAYL